MYNLGMVEVESKWENTVEFYNHILKEMDKCFHEDRKLKVLERNNIGLVMLKGILSELVTSDKLHCNYQTRRMLENLIPFAYGSFNKLAGHPVLMYNYYRDKENVPTKEMYTRMRQVI